MTATTKPLRERQAWKSLANHYEKIRHLHLRQIFADDPARGERMAAEGAGLYLDYSKNRITDETLKLLFQLADECELRGRIDAMFRGDKINVTENRAVLHVALRAPRGASITLEGENVVAQVHSVLDKMADFSTRVRKGEWKGYTGKRIRNVINIGIGGSDLGPVMAYGVGLDGEAEGDPPYDRRLPHPGERHAQAGVRPKGRVGRLLVRRRHRLVTGHCYIDYRTLANCATS